MLGKVSPQAGLRQSFLTGAAARCALRLCYAWLVQDKIEVNGKNAHPLYGYLKKATKTGMPLLPDACSTVPRRQACCTLLMHMRAM